MMYNCGDIVRVYDIVDDDIFITGVIKYIEPDKETPGLFWLYIVANNLGLNIHTDPNLPLRYYTVLEDTSDRLELISKAVD